MAGRQTSGGLFMPAVPFEDKTDIKPLEMETNLTSLAPSLRKILQMNAQTSEEKFKVLDARDKLYKMMRDKDPTLKRSALVATCPDMCPEKERLLRDYQGRGSIFEMTNISKNSNFNHSLAVKEYARSSADQEEPLPHDLRPIHVLTMTMSHLLHNVVDYCELSDENLEEWYMFMWDRTRALRKELTQQRVCSLESVTLVEQCARFHIHCAERLIDQDSSIYDDKINTENLTKCLQTLKYMYKDLAKEDIKCPNEPEFICYSLLLNLNNSSVCTELGGMSSSLMTSEPVRFALNVMTMWETKNYIRFFNLVKKTTYLNCCLLRRYFGEMRLYAIKTMIRSYCTKNYSPQILISRFVEMLNFEREEECLNFLSYCNFNFHLVEGKTVVNFDRVLFQNPTNTVSTGRAFLFIEEKKQRPLSVIMAGGTLPPRLFENYVPHSSFTPEGDLNPEAMPQKELLEFFSSSNSSKNDSNKSAPTSLEMFPEREKSDPAAKFQKEENTWFSHGSMFSFEGKSPPSTNIFGATQTSFSGPVPTSSNIFGNNFTTATTGSFGNIFGISGAVPSAKNIFGNQGSPALFGNIKPAPFGTGAKTFPMNSFSFGQQETSKVEPNVAVSDFKDNSSSFASGFQNRPDPRLEEAKIREEKERRERLEKERQEKEKEEKRKREEEEKAKMLLEMQRLQEENRRKELEKREREKKEEDERRKREELARLEKEERKRREEAARQERLKEANARHLEELRRQEETKRRIEMEYKRKVDTKMMELKEKIQSWKTKIIFDKWRMKTWAGIEERKMKEYFKEVKVKYPPVCTEELLNGNPYGLVIPNALTFEKFRDWKKEFVQEPTKRLLIVNDDLPLLKINCILGKSLENLARSLGTKLDPFPWKLVISVPDELESPDFWKSIETFVEMHFVEHFSWQFGVQKGPLYCRGGSRGPFRFNISIRRLRGVRLFEGSEPNPSATRGSNALIFFVSESGNEMTQKRLETVLRSRSPLPKRVSSCPSYHDCFSGLNILKNISHSVEGSYLAALTYIILSVIIPIKIPIVIIVLNGHSDVDYLKKSPELQNLEKLYISKCLAVSVFDEKHEPVVQLTKSLQLAASNSAPPSPLRVNKFSVFFSGTWIDSLWRRVEISLSNFKITLQEPKALIEFYNTCIEELVEIFLDQNHNDHTVLAQEFSECEVDLITRNPAYRNRLKSLLHRLKLPHWPAETPKSCHQLNYRIHQYCKKITGQNKPKIKNLKWILYRIIRQSLSWKGLDIYCDEDVYEILTNFPWIQVFQEVSRVITRQLCEEAQRTEDLTLMYDTERMEKFSFESSFIGNFLKASRKRSSRNSEHGEEELDELNPCLEKDSVVYAYSAAIERESNKRKREERVEEGLDALFSRPAGKRLILEEEEEARGFDFTGMEANFQSLEERLNAMKKQVIGNLKILTDIHNEMQ